MTEYEVVDNIWFATDEETKIFALGKTKEEAEIHLNVILQVYYNDKKMK